MEQSFYVENRRALYRKLTPGSLVLLFAGKAPRKTADEYYPFFAKRNFLYMTGVQQQGLVFAAVVGEGDSADETMYILPPDEHAERWMGARIKADEVAARGGVMRCAYSEQFMPQMKRLLDSFAINQICLDLDKLDLDEPDDEAYQFAKSMQSLYPAIPVKNIHRDIAAQRTIKKPCEIEAMRKAELITRDGILAMMKASKPGMYEYQYKAEFDYALAQHGVLSPAFPSIISAGKNNFCIHYYSYRGQAMDGDMILNDVGACWDDENNDVSRGWPCNGKFNDRQRALYECAYQTSNHMFSILKPGFRMADVDLTARKYNYELLHDLGLVDSYENVGKLIWHGGAHHVGLDTHDVIAYDPDMPIQPGMVFCVDIGIYCEEWGIGFRLEDNCLITETGCENLSACTPRSIEDIEAAMGKR